MRAVLNRVVGATVRAILVAILVAMPAFLLPNISQNSAELARIAALIAGGSILFEYGFQSTSFLEFRFAAPYNRMRFAFFGTVLILSIYIIRGSVAAPNAPMFLESLSAASHELWSGNYSPPAVLAAMFHQAGPERVALIRSVAEVAITSGLIGVLAFSLIVWLLSWPIGKGNFNLWINLPTHEAAIDDGAVDQLYSRAATSLLFGFLLPYGMPAALLYSSGPLAFEVAMNNQTAVWLVAIWAFVPVASIMRAVTLAKLAALIKAPQEEPVEA